MLFRESLKFTSTEIAGNVSRTAKQLYIDKKSHPVKESNLKATRGFIINPLVLKHSRHITKLDAWQHLQALSFCFTHITVNTIKNLGSFFLFSCYCRQLWAGGGGGGEG